MKLLDCNNLLNGSMSELTSLEFSVDGCLLQLFISISRVSNLPQFNIHIGACVDNATRLEGNSEHLSLNAWRL